MSTLPNPIGRLAFLGRLLVGIVASVALYLGFVWGMWFAIGRGRVPESVPVVFLCFGLWFVAFIFLAMCFVRFGIVARLASIGANRWLALLILIPYVSILFLLFLLFYPAKMEVKNEPVA